MKIQRWVLITAAMATSCVAAEHARNVVLFLGDGTGPATVNAAGIYGYGKPRSLFVQSMPYIGLSETSSASSWVTDSAAGMTAIVTGEKTHNGVISQSAAAERGVRDGEPLKTILEYAEERGLSTGLVSNSSMADATPAACYAHSNDRSKHGEIFAQVTRPRFGDGVDVIIGPGRTPILERTAALGVRLAEELESKGYLFADSLAALEQNPGARRAVVLFPTDDFDLSAAVDHAVHILTQNPKGFFLMVESNNHSRNVTQTLERTVVFDRIIRRTAGRLSKDTLILFTADHSFDLRLPGGRIGEDIVPRVRVDGSHTAEEVLVAAQGPGGSQVHGIFANTQLFHIMMNAFGWRPDSPAATDGRTANRVPAGAPTASASSTPARAR